MKSVVAASLLAAAVVAEPSVCPFADFTPKPAGTLPKSTGTIKATIELSPDPVNKLNNYRMVGVDMDWWGPTKDKWGMCGMTNIDLNNKDLKFLVSELGGKGKGNGGSVRLGGTGADFIVYDVVEDACSPENLNKTQKPPGATWYCPLNDALAGKCLTMQKWDEVMAFMSEVDMGMIFCLNACWLRPGRNGTIDWSLTKGFLEYSAKKHWTHLAGFEFGNELYQHVDPDVYGNDYHILQTIVNETWAKYNNTNVPFILGPDDGPTGMGTQWTETLLDNAKGSIDGISVHIYLDDCATKPPGTVLNISCLNYWNQKMVPHLNPTVEKYGIKQWNMESSLVGDSGVLGISNTFRESFWYFDSLGLMAQNHFEMFGRQTLIGGDYEIIDKNTTQPNPDYWLLKVWQEVMGKTVYNTSVSCDDASKCENIRVYSHSTLDDSGKVVMILNFDMEHQFAPSINWGIAATSIDLFQFTGDVNTSVVFLNGNRLHYSGDQTLPPLTPKVLNPPESESIILPPASISFFIRNI
eukprot:TRINITY_DN373_c0_g2_i1.p1 TRINITY_DN373_c0_g2~~TRINITY_DN373_c0_g2_i1.p1  ORF type:complete len:524 (+),score=108.89 TRINITY_DN373_c0_g2_i1:50-1621(+)